MLVPLGLRLALSGCKGVRLELTEPVGSFDQCPGESQALQGFRSPAPSASKQLWGVSQPVQLIAGTEEEDGN